jgi:hypothetical protein
VNIEVLTTLHQSGIGLIDGEDAAARIEICDVTGLQALPTTVLHPLGEKCIEDQTASRREHESPLRRTQGSQTDSDSQQV